MRKNNRCPPLQQVWYYPALESQDPDIAAMEGAAYVSRKYFQLKSGHAVTGTYLHPIGRAKID